MSEKIDPYFKDRLEKARQHRVLRSIEITESLKEVGSNKELPNIAIEGTIEEFGWSEKSVENFIDALDREMIKVERIDEDHIRVEFLPIQILPEELGHISELRTIEDNLKRKDVFGSQESSAYTYLQTPDFAVEGYMDDEQGGKLYGRVFVNSKKLAEKRNVYLDPESLHVTDYEYGYSYCVRGGVPLQAIRKVDVIQAKRVALRKGIVDIDKGDWPEDAEQYMSQQTQRLKEYIDKKLGS